MQTALHMQITRDTQSYETALRLWEREIHAARTLDLALARARLQPHPSSMARLNPTIRTSAARIKTAIDAHLRERVAQEADPDVLRNAWQRLRGDFPRAAQTAYQRIQQDFSS